MSDSAYPEIVLSHRQASQLLDARGKLDHVESSADLGRSQVLVALDQSGATFPNGVIVAWDALEKIQQEQTKCFAVDAEGIRAISVFSETTNWVRTLMPTETIPTTLVSGLTMHRIKHTDPRADTIQKIKATRPRGRVLDTALGLGYTAIEAARAASEVVTVEIDPAAIEITRQNPWSRELFEWDNIEIIVGDIIEEIERFDDASFDRIIHDPPALRLAGDLYALDFYRQLRRVLKPRGRLFHYIGDPSGRTGKALTNGVIRRLHEAGFERVDRCPRAYGVLATSSS